MARLTAPRPLVAAAVALAVGGAGLAGWGVTHRPVGPPPAAVLSAAPVTAPAPAPAQSAPTQSAPTQSAPTQEAEAKDAPTNEAAADGSALAVRQPDHAVAVAPLPASAPTRVAVPALGLDHALTRLGLDSSGAMQVPKDATGVGWFTGSPTPGAKGPAVLAAHVDYGGKAGPFYRLGRMRPGQRVDVTRADGKVARFTVTAVQEYPKDAFPSAAVFANLPYAGLRLITCGGTFDHRTGHYEDNVVVYAELTDVL